MDETIASSTSYVSVDMGQHKKRSSSTMSPPSTYNNQNPSDMSIDSTHPNATSNCNNDNIENEDNRGNYERPLKQPFRQLTPIDTTSHRHWSNTEQEALYVAVERHHLYGHWAEVRDRMQLNRSVEEIELEYTRIYGELPESDIDYDDDDDDDWSSSGYDPAPGSSSSSAGPTYRSSFPNLNHGVGGAATPALTPASQSRRSSQEMYGSYPYPHSTHSSSRRPSYQTNRSMHSRSPDDGYDFDHDGGSDTRMRDRDSSYLATSPTTPKSRGTGGGSGKRGRGGGSAAAAADRAATAAAAAARGATGGDGGDAKPTRTVRVWTLQQSEQLKNLIETCFPGGYRINWVWVASQMGNTFTRKQCKNKWEIMRRRAGTDEEIALLKRGYEEFGPSWSQIQEKYLPERSQGGISIMWGLLQAREEEEERKQQQQSTSSSSSARGMSVDHVSPTTGSGALGPMTPVSPSRSRKESVGGSAGATFRSQTPSHISTSSVTSPTGPKKGAIRRPSLTTPLYGASSRHHWPPVE
ncbi:hypothetical protein BGZ96_001048 [Linnemannia gamsii]|uniref:Myb-like domain-containing protein n=1 Tax=Linnemannia gamsii TaxID=64522 RepID=A0ABQ7JMW1_9FUNG|nr:hypothetical protein BGZ96_001048 [Linnemannia gamsii]